MQSIAGKIGCTAETLRSWVQRAEAQADPTRNAALADRERLKQLERENAELKRANEILRKASAFFAQAELDRKRTSVYRVVTRASVWQATDQVAATVAA
jgi:transposase-like protein